MHAIMKMLSKVISIISGLVNILMILVVWQTRRKKTRTILMANWSILTCLAAIVGIFEYENTPRFVYGPGTCHFMEFLKNLILNMVPLNVYVIVYEMSWQLGPRNGILLAKKILSQCYAIATIGAFGTIFMTEYEEGEDDVDECVKVPLWNSVKATVSFETVRALAFHVVIPVLIATVLNESRVKMKFLRTLQDQHAGPTLVDGKLRRVRWFFGYSTIFALIWISFGIFLAWHRVHVRVTPDYTFSERTSILINLSICTFYVYVSMGPMIVLWSGDVNMWERLTNLFARSGTAPPPQNGQPIQVVM
ncbi:Prolactin-releasing peptide receptor [Folsomia candida]|uniref:Prolactin-releasing peptide receptor n=1 Tax=Folsomia candida TaxID=158441 RepID=A0A226DRD6_FOLCA|nr:Prolactin-releasing peptide receptor [Folsomia candida]